MHLSFPEVHGLSRYPFHSKSRYMLPYLVDKANLDTDVLGRPLATAIDFNVDPWLSNLVSARLCNYCGFGNRKLCLVSRNGYTVHGKNWGYKWRDDTGSGEA